jgi:hypothetical protein
MNAAELYRALEEMGWSVQRISVAGNGAGVPDAMVAKRGEHITHLLEVKRLGRHLSKAQILWAMKWPGCVHVATNSWEADKLLKECESMARYSTVDEAYAAAIRNLDR